MQTDVEAFIQDMTELGFEVALEAELVIYQVVAIDGAYAGKPMETGVAMGETSALAPGAAALASLSCWLEVLAHQQPAVSKVWMVDAQPSDNGVGRCSGWSRVGEPCPGSPQ